MNFRRFIAFVTLAVAGLTVVGAPAATPDSGTVRPPSGMGLGPKITWTGTHYAVAANTNFSCTDATEPCDVFHLNVPVPASFWKGKGGGVTIGLTGYDENQDFDMRIFVENPDGTPGKRVGQSARAAGVLEKTTIEKPSGKYMVVVYPYSVINSQADGEAFFDVKPPRPGLPNVTVPGLDNVRASFDKYNSHSEPSIAMNPRNHDNLVASSKMYTNLPAYRFKVGTYYSMDGGKTWKDNGHLPGYPEGEEDYITSDPSMAFDDEGNAYIFVLDSGIDWSGMNVHISRDGGKTWSDPIVVHRYNYTGTPADGFAQIFDDKNWIVVDNNGGDGDGTVGTIYTCWNADVIAATPAAALFYGQIVVSRSTDAGATWSEIPIPIHGPANPTPVVPLGDDVIGCQVVVAPDGALYVFWADYGNNEIRYVKSTNQGQTFTFPPNAVATMDPPPALPNTQFRNPIFPSVGIGPDGTITVVWGSDRFSDGDADIVVSRSTDGGGSWSEPLRVNDDTGHASQFQPWIAVTESGQMNVFFFDRRNDPNNMYIDTYVARSADGVHWKNNRVSSRMWDPFLNPPITGGSQFIGDYQGIVADDNVAIPFWQDTTSGVYQEVYSARVPNTKSFGGPKPDTTVLGRTTPPRAAPPRSALPATGVGSRAAGALLLGAAFVVAALLRTKRIA
jgi:BNR/Asp-box repeat protein